MKLNLFEFYLDNFLKLPSDIKNDLIYCQRALKTHVKVHQIVINVFQQEDNFDPEQKKRILEEIETEMYEINAEQQFLFMRLRRVVDEFCKMLTKNKVSINMNATNAYISKQIVAGVSDESIDVKPMEVQLRRTEEKLLKKYFETEKPNGNSMQEEQQVHAVPKVMEVDEDLHEVVEIPEEPKIVYEIVSSDEDSQPVVIAEKVPRKQELKQIIKVDLTNESNAPLRNSNGNHLSQMSLLKPMAQRLTKTTTATATATVADVRANDAAHFIPIDVVGVVKKERLSPEVLARIARTYEEASTSAAAAAASAASIKKETSEEPVAFFVSKTVKMSRLNLRQALKKARTENMAAKAAASANILATRTPAVDDAKTTTTKPSPPKRVTPPKRTSPPKRNSPPLKRYAPTPPLVAAATAANAVPAPLKKAAKKVRATRGAAAAALAKSAAINSSSEDSNRDRTPTPPVIPPPPPPPMPSEPQDTRTMPEHYGQEDFLGYFKLYTAEKFVQMQQRRSKRKRRTVYSNERADFHYGRIEYGSAPSTESNKKKQRKTFLLSPRVKRGRKRTSAETKTDEAVVPSRSSSSSPDEKRDCNECLKAGGCLDQCVECKGFYHQQCHYKEDLSHTMPCTCLEDHDNRTEPCAKRTSPTNIKIDLCPACLLIQKKFLLSKEKQQNQTLNSTVDELENKYIEERHRRFNLQQTNKDVKLQVRKLFNIVNVIRYRENDENDSSD